ncbi:MAG: glycosyltransferase family 4 protein [Pseudomonadota bacterium]
MRLALIIPEWGEVAGGIATYYRHLVPELISLGHDVQVFVGSSSVIDEEPQEPFAHGLQNRIYQQHLQRFAHLKPLAGLDRHLAAAWALKQQVDEAAREQPFDVVECCDWGLGFMPWLESDTPLAVRLHASLSQIADAEQLPGERVFQTVTALIEQLGLTWADGLVTYANANADRWSALLGKPVSVIRPPYPLAEISGGTGRALVSGKIQRWKGVEVLLQAMERVPDAQLDWYGRDMPTRLDGKPISMSELMAKRFPKCWGSRLIPRGMVSPSELAKRRRESAFVVVPSRWDVFNLTAVEAMASGIPAIVSSGAGASELVEHGENGFRFEADDPAGLADCLCRCLALRPAEREAMGAAARATVAEQLDPANQARRHVEFYERVASVERPARPVDLWGSILDSAGGQTGAGDLAQNIAGRDLAKALVERGAQRLGLQR